MQIEKYCHQHTMVIDKQYIGYTLRNSTNCGGGVVVLLVYTYTGTYTYVRTTYLPYLDVT